MQYNNIVLESQNFHLTALNAVTIFGGNVRKGLMCLLVSVAAQMVTPSMVSAAAAQQVIGQNGACGNYNPNLAGSRVGVAKVSVSKAVSSPGWQLITTSASFNNLAPNTAYAFGLALNQNSPITTGCFVPSWLIFTTDHKGAASVTQSNSVYTGNYGYQVVVSHSGDLVNVDGVTSPSSITVP